MPQDYVIPQAMPHAIPHFTLTVEIGHLSLVHLHSVEVWDRACLSVWDLWACVLGCFLF